MITKSHYIFVFPVRPWPLLASFNSFVLLFSMILFLKFGASLGFLIVMVNISFCSFCWWLFYRSEFNFEGQNSFNLESGLKSSMLLFISSEVFFFFSFFWSYFHFFLSPTIEIGMEWPPLRVEIFDFLNVPLINTLVLMRSGVTVTIRHHFLIEGKKKLFILFLGVTILLGLIFTGLQAMEYVRSFFSIRDRTFGTSFFMLTGFHGIHVLIGTLFLFVSLFQSIKIVCRKMEYLRFELASWYWHFVDVVWIFLYFIIYYLNN